MTTHTWKPGASGLITDPANYVDGTSLEPGDTLLLHDGTASADGIGTLADATLGFDVTGVQAEFDFQDLTLAANLTLDVAGPGPLALDATGNSISQGSIDIANGSVTLSVLAELPASAGSFTNAGTLEIDNAGTLTINPFENGIFLNSGALDITAGGTLDYAITAGSGNTIDGTFRNDSTISVDGVGAALRIGGFYQGTAGNLIAVDGGAAASATGVQFDDPVSGANISLADGNATALLAMQASTIDFVGNAYLYLDYVAPVLATGAPPTFGAGAGANTLESFSSGDALLVAATANDIAYDPTSHVLTADESGTVVATFLLAGTYQQSDFSLITDSPSLPIGTFAIEDSVACFRQGTSIATPTGDRAVETLAIGDHVLTACGKARPVRWLGHRRVDCARHPRPQDVWPVRVAAHAFGLGRPARDLFLSPDHAVFVQDVLIPVRYLVNGATVRQEEVASVTYWHVELPRHDVLLANGMPAETYLDTGNRAAFANGGKAIMAYPDFARAIWDGHAIAPLVTEGPARDLVYRQLLVQAIALGWRPTDAGDGATLWREPPSADEAFPPLHSHG